MKFELTEKQIKRVEEWKKTVPPMPKGSIGSRWVYTFIPTHTLLVVKVMDAHTKMEIDVTEYW